MFLDHIIRGLSVLRAHYGEGPDPVMSAPSGELVLTKTDTPLDEAEVAELRTLGWYQPDAYPDEDYPDDRIPPYDPGLAWSYDL